VTAGLGTPSTLTCTGSRNTAPDTPLGVVIAAITSAKQKPSSQSSISAAAP
jgi:hypothetical protein